MFDGLGLEVHGVRTSRKNVGCFSADPEELAFLLTGLVMPHPLLMLFGWLVEAVGGHDLLKCQTSLRQ